MKSILQLFQITCFCLITLGTVHAQFGGLKDKIVNRTKDKLERKAEQKLVEEISEEIARRAFKPIDKAMDNMLRSSYEKENGGEVDWEEAGAKYGEFLAGLNKAADVPPSYSFDLIMEIEVKDGKNEKHKMEYYLSKTDPVMGMRQMENKNQFMVFDAGNDIIVLYTDDGNDRSAQAIPSMLQMASAMAETGASEYDKQELKIDKTGKTKKIAGYQCDEYKIESDEEKITAYIAQDFPVSIRQTFGQMMDKFVPENYKKASDIQEGMMLKSIYKSKEKKEYDSTWETKKVKEKSFTIDNSHYGLGQT